MTRAFGLSAYAESNLVGIGWRADHGSRHFLFPTERHRPLLLSAQAVAVACSGLFHCPTARSAAQGR